MQQKLTCILCPRGCILKLEKIEKEVMVTGQGCKRGVMYALSEVQNPQRTLTTTIAVLEGNEQMCPLISSKPLPKAVLLDCMKQVYQLQVLAPISQGDIIVENVYGDVHLLASKAIKRKED